MAVRVRFAPSPTGDLHLGGLRTALYNYLFAKRHGGKVLLRIEDTDQNRLVPGSETRLLSDLKRCGITFDEGPGDVIGGGPFGPYRQSDRQAEGMYKTWSDALVKESMAYPCFCSKQRLEDMRESARSAGHGSLAYDRACRDIDPREARARIADGEEHVIRFKCPTDNDETTVEDLVHGKIGFKHKSLDDHILVKADGWPTYHLANVVDDQSMEISHVLRGDEWLPSVAKHQLLHERLCELKGYSSMKHAVIPQFAHLPLIQREDGRKLSKRHDNVFVSTYLDQEGYLPEALTNFVAMLGWRHYSQADMERNDRIIDHEQPPGDDDLQHVDVMSMVEMEAKFDIRAVTKHPATFARYKLDFLNRVHMIKLCTRIMASSNAVSSEESLMLRSQASELATMVRNGVESQLPPGMLADVDEDSRKETYTLRCLDIVKERIHRPQEAVVFAPFLWTGPLWMYDYDDGTKNSHSESSMIFPHPKDDCRKWWNELCSKIEGGDAILRSVLEQHVATLRAMPVNDCTVDASVVHNQLITPALKLLRNKKGPAMQSLRLAVSGSRKGPGVPDLVAVLGPGRVAHRIEAFLGWLDGTPA
eukprot:Clim_evm49s77 gene=Clim_evmTU49s77